jgi:hypothetical protein
MVVGDRCLFLKGRHDNDEQFVADVRNRHVASFAQPIHVAPQKTRAAIEEYALIN